MTPAELEIHVLSQFQDDLEADLAFERAISRRCVYAILIVIAVVVVRALWFV